MPIITVPRSFGGTLLVQSTPPATNVALFVRSGIVVAKVRSGVADVTVRSGVAGATVRSGVAAVKVREQ